MSLLKRCEIGVTSNLLLTSATVICLAIEFFFKFDAGHVYDRSMTYMFEINVFGNAGYCQILHQVCWLMQMQLYIDPELGIGNYLK